MNGAQIQGYINQNYPELGQLTNEQIQVIQNNAGGGQPGMIDQAIKSSPQYQAYTTTQAQQQYQQGINTAVTGLQNQQTSLQQSYGSLLNDVMGQGTVAMNTADQAQNALLASRGITTSSAMGGTALSSAQLAVQQANQAASGSIGLGSAQDINAIQQSIAGIQAGAAGTAAQLPLEYGSLANATNLNTSQIALNAAQGQEYQNIGQAELYPTLNTGQGQSLYNISNGSIIGLQQLAQQLGYNITKA